MSDKLSAANSELKTGLHRVLDQRGPKEAPDWYVVCGSGIGGSLVRGEDGSGLQIDVELDFDELGLPGAQVAGHGRALVFGRIGASRVCLQTGRLHPYEGHAAQTSCAALDVLLERGTAGVLLTCAVGGLDPDLAAGQLVSLRDQINLFGPTPLQGARFIDCSRLYDPALRARLQGLAERRSEKLPEVVYAHARGPQYETPAECEALRRLGGEIVGMSTTYEAITVASHARPCAGLGVVTNAAGADGLSHEEVQQRALEARGRLASLVGDFLASPPCAD